MNKKGFTLVELLAVIVILGLLATVAILSMSNVLENARKDTYLANVRAAIDAARNDYMIKNPDKWYWTKADINAELEKKIDASPFGGTYSTVLVVRATDGTWAACTVGSTAGAGSLKLTTEATLNSSSAKDRVNITAVGTCPSYTSTSNQPTSLSDAS